MMSGMGSAKRKQRRVGGVSKSTRRLRRRQEENPTAFAQHHQRQMQLQRERRAKARILRDVQREAAAEEKRRQWVLTMDRYRWLMEQWSSVHNQFVEASPDDIKAADAQCQNSDVIDLAFGVNDLHLQPTQKGTELVHESDENELMIDDVVFSSNFNGKGAIDRSNVEGWGDLDIPVPAPADGAASTGVYIPEEAPSSVGTVQKFIPEEAPSLVCTTKKLTSSNESLVYQSNFKGQGEWDIPVPADVVASTRVYIPEEAPSLHSTMTKSTSPEEPAVESPVKPFVPFESLPLSPKDLQRVKECLELPRGTKKTLRKKGHNKGGGGTIQLDSLLRLREKTWLNDEVVNTYFTFLQEWDVKLCASNQSRKPSLFLNSFFIQKLFDLKNKSSKLRGKYRFENVQRWAMKMRRKAPDGDLLQLRRIFCPVHLGNHWVCAVIDIEEKAIMWYDSMGATDVPKQMGLLRFLSDACKDSSGNSCVTKSEWSLVACDREKIPQQYNSESLSNCMQIY